MYVLACIPLALVNYVRMVVLELHFNSLLQLCSPESLELGRDVDCKIVVAVAAEVSGLLRKCC